MQTSELTGAALDRAVAKALNLPEPYFNNGVAPQFSTDWAQGGPIIEREYIEVVPWHDGDRWSWSARSAPYNKPKTGGRFEGFGPTPLIAAMRCFVSSRLGDEVELPEELK